jgi:hypothetical protein
VQVKLLPQDGELFVFAQSAHQVAKQRAMRRRQLKWLWGRLKQFAGMTQTGQELLMRLGTARKQARMAWRLLAIEVAKDSARSCAEPDAVSCCAPVPRQLGAAAFGPDRSPCRQC